MRFSKSYIKTLKETPKEAEIPSHQLMLRAGMIKRLASGVYSFLPLGYKGLRKVENIVREEMNRAGAQEMLMPIIQPSELWKESGRWDTMGAEMFRLKDRHDRDFVLGPTHEEVITDIVRNDISSYKALPLNLYQIQTKFRDERRPRFGLMRGREFLMKDAYSFHANLESLDEEFLNMKDAYSRIFERCGLQFRAVEADSGNIGGSGSQEFHVLAETGEDEIIYCDSCSYAANIEAAASKFSKSETTENSSPKLVDTPAKTSIEEVSTFLNIDTDKTVKALVYKDISDDSTLYVALIRGDYEVNEVKLKNKLSATELILASDEDLKKFNLVKGFIGAYKLNKENIKVIADESIVDLKNHVSGANKVDAHYTNLSYGRDYTADLVADIRTVKVLDICPCCDGQLQSARGIETGHIFKLGNKYSEALNASFLDDKGKSNFMEMGCYGIGVSRTMAAAIEQNFDDFGIIWPSAIAPYIVDVIPTNIKNAEQLDLANKIYTELCNENIDTIIDDRDERPGFKFKDADLIGFPFKIVVGKRAAESIVELKIRRTGETIEIGSELVIDKVKELMKTY